VSLASAGAAVVAFDPSSSAALVSFAALEAFAPCYINWFN
jgi:hypothetical protein